jgi:hypothetical protein
MLFEERSRSGDFHQNARFDYVRPDKRRSHSAQRGSIVNPLRCFSCEMYHFRFTYIFAFQMFQQIQ